ncbi:PVC-type heme-binding CxxCH protein [Arenibacter sp. ARW7G5Y1]|uniref:PVC-type heme-binding CxxCH protein n=1 Tax=Arenibacter sp. ARW7G5Y1 TaxID=2135619 RepID=UPI000D772375|nr:PVC-type heme-binding CxxCH protein [Arenibacter sp. ARW7G5Y1]
MNSFISRFGLSILFICVMAGCNQSKKKDDNEPRRLEVLFLGDANENHNSREYAPIMAQALSKSGINISYTEDLEDLNTYNLSLYDGLIIYANYDTISKGKEKALLDFVRSGHAFIPIHSASFCFRNSLDYIDMVGGQFMSHNTATFTAKIVNMDHPIMKNVKEFSTWDETYVHDHLSKDRTVLMERMEVDHHEPYTWVKNYGEGRVFYTAYGHDGRTWKNPEFQNLIKQGILWGVNHKAKAQWEKYEKTIPKLIYKKMPNIPNYEMRDSVPEFQEPLTPEESKKLIQVPAGFDLKLFASEPEIINPIAMNWDEKGRLWVVETVDYPNTIRNDKGTGDDRIKICEDTNGDGMADKFTVFAQNLNIPTSFTFANGGIIISQAPDFLFLKDTDGDDKADVKKVIMTGWGTFDTHAGPSNLQRGMDNKIYGVVGYSGFKGEIAGQRYQFGQAVYRFHPDISDFEVVANTSNNTWGLGFTEDNSLFASTANNTHSVYVGIPNNYFNGVEGIPKEGNKKIDGHYSIHPITSQVRQVDVFGGFTAASGHNFYTARSYPAKYWNKIAFVCEPTGHLVHMAKIEKDGAGYTESDYWNLFASADEWVSPVAAKVGPDGAVWVLDWYNFIVQHNPTPTEERGGYNAETGEGNAYVNPLRDKSRGRIWRVVWKGAKEFEPMELSKDEPKKLIDALTNDNMFWRTTAQRLLVERDKRDVLPELYDMVNNKEVDTLGLDSGALHALWTIYGLSAIGTEKNANDIVTGALKHPSYAVRKAAIEILPKNEIGVEALLKSNLIHDKNPVVQLASLLYLAERPSSYEIGKALYLFSKEDEVLHDAWLARAVYVAATKHSKGFLIKYKEEHPNYSEKFKKKKDLSQNDLDVSNWKDIKLPQLIHQKGLDTNGFIWFRKNFEISLAESGKKGTISLGPIYNSDIVYINGNKIGITRKIPNKNRIYAIPKGVLKAGRNHIAVMVKETGKHGGFAGRPDQMFVTTGEDKTSLSGDWKYQLESDYNSLKKNIFKDITLADFFAENYMDKPTPVEGKEQQELSYKNTIVINIKTIKNEMKFDISEFVVSAGKPVEIVLENPDFMQHNLVITKPGEKEKVGAAADNLATDPQGADIHYVPNIPEVLFSSPLLDPQETIKMRFIAPDKPGLYPFICTFPGHWRIMQGIMKVVPAKK